MQPATNSIATEIRSTLSGIFNVMTMFETMPTSYMRAFIAVAKHEGELVDYYARICGCSNGAMSKRLNDLGDLDLRDRTKPGYGLLELKPNLMDRRYTLVRLSAKGRNFVGQVVKALEMQASVPILAEGNLPRTSAPRLPHTLQTNRSAMSDSRT